VPSDTSTATSNTPATHFLDREAEAYPLNWIPRSTTTGRFLHAFCGKYLDNVLSRAKIPDNSQMSDAVGQHLMNFIQPSIAKQSHPQSEAMDQKCLHPRVQIVSRDEDAEFVECLECREIFESSEFRDMDIEAKIPTEEE
jgi:hypothetical protein